MKKLKYFFLCISVFCLISLSYGIYKHYKTFENYISVSEQNMLAVTNGTINFLNLNGSTLSNGTFSGCSGGSRGQACSYTPNLNYVFPTASTNSMYGAFVGWAIDGVEKYCSGEEATLFSAGASWRTGTSSTWDYYAIFEKTCNEINGDISFLNLDSGTISGGNFSYCSGGDKGQVCSYAPNVNYKLPSASSSSTYGSFLGWAIDEVEKYCSGEETTLLSADEDWSVSTSDSWKYYAIYENSCGKSEGESSSNPSESSGEDPDFGVQKIDPTKVECSSIFGPEDNRNELYHALQDIFNLLKFAAPILLVVLSTIDYIKAITSHDAEGLKKANEKFVKRLAIGVAIFMLPFILDFVFEVFGVYDIQTCGIGK